MLTYVSTTEQDLKEQIMKITRTVNPNGTYRYEIDGKVQYAASKVLYTHASAYSVNDFAQGPSTPVLFHKTEGAAMRAKGYASSGWVKTGVLVIEDASAPSAPVEAAPAEAEAPEAEPMTTFEVTWTVGDTVIESRKITVPTFGVSPEFGACLTRWLVARASLKAWGLAGKMTTRRLVDGGTRWTLTDRNGHPLGAVTVTEQVEVAAPAPVEAPAAVRPTERFSLNGRSVSVFTDHRGGRSMRLDGYQIEPYNSNRFINYLRNGFV